MGAIAAERRRALVALKWLRSLRRPLVARAGRSHAGLHGPRACPCAAMRLPPQLHVVVPPSLLCRVNAMLMACRATLVPSGALPVVASTLLLHRRSMVRAPMLESLTSVSAFKGPLGSGCGVGVVSSVPLGSGLSEGHAEATRAGRDAASPWPTVTCTCDVRLAYDRSGCEVRLVVHSGPSDAWCELLGPG